MVNEGKREKRDPSIVVDAKELAGFTIRVTSNEKNFPKRYRMSVVNKIQERAISIVEELTIANEIYPDTKEEFAARRLHQKEARASCRALILLVEIAANTFQIRSSTFTSWVKQTTDLQKHITTWIRSDDNRFKNYRGTD